MRIVSNTTPISELYKIGALDLLRLVYQEVHIPEAVAEELSRTPNRPGLSRIVEQNAWIKTQALLNDQATTVIRVRHPAIHLGEAAAMVLARELNANRIILDDKRAREAALHEHLPVIGTVGVILLACRRKLITTEQGQELLDKLYSGTAYISKRLYLEASRQLSP